MFFVIEDREMDLRSEVGGYKRLSVIIWSRWSRCGGVEAEPASCVDYVPYMALLIQNERKKSSLPQTTS